MLKNGGKLCFVCLGIKQFSRGLTLKRCYNLANKTSPNKCTNSSFSRNDARFFANLNCESARHTKDENDLNLKVDVEALDYLTSINPELINTENVCSILNQVSKKHYKQLCNESEYLQTNASISYLQLQVQAKLSKGMESINSNERFLHLCKILDENVDAIEIDKIIEVLQTLIHLNVPSDDPLIYKLIVRLSDDVNLNHIDDLSKLINTVSCLPGMQCKLKKKSIDGMKLFVEENQNPTVDEVCDVANISTNHTNYITRDTMVKIHDWLVKSIKSLDINSHVGCISALMKFLHKCHQDYDIALDSEAMIILEDACLNNIHSLEYHHINDICLTLKRLRRFYGKFNSVMEKHALDLLSHDLRLPDLLCIMSGLTKSSPHLKKFEEILCSKLDASEPIDALLLSSLSRQLTDLHISNNGLMKLFHRYVAENSEAVLSLLPWFHRVSKQLMNKPFLDPDLESKFVQEVLKKMDREDGLSISTYSCLGLYLLSLKNFSLIPQHALMGLISSLPRWDFFLLSKLNNHLTSACAKNKNQHFKDLYEKVQQQMAHKLNEDNSNLNFLLANRFSSHIHKSCSSSLSNVTINSLEVMTKNLDLMQLKKVLSFMLNTNYHVPEVFENIVNKVVSDMKDDDVMLDTLRVVSKANYRPLGMEQFAGLVMNIYKKKFENQEYLDCLHILSNLAYLQYFPKKELKEFFSVDVIEDLEKLAGDNSVEFIIMNLNRSVVIECPELGIPWFHEHYSPVSRSEFGDFKNGKYRFGDEVHFSLIDVLGDSKFINENTLSPYFHEINFECNLDYSGRPIPVIALQSKSQKHTKRVAVCLRHNFSFCKDSKVDTGYFSMIKRQLKMLNYQVLEVPYTEWFSYGMQDRKNRVRYLKKKFSEIGVFFRK